MDNRNLLSVGKRDRPGTVPGIPLKWLKDHMAFVFTGQAVQEETCMKYSPEDY
jgi:hypothetical protein